MCAESAWNTVCLQFPAKPYNATRGRQRSRSLPEPKAQSTGSLPTEHGSVLRLFHALLRIPRSLQFAHINDLSNMVSIVAADLRNGGSPRRQLLFICSVDNFFQLSHDLIQFFDCVIPLIGVKLIERFFVVATEFFLRLAFEVGQVPAIPEQQVIRELSHRMAAVRRLPTGLVGGESFDGCVDGHEPVCLVVGSAQLLQQDTSQRRGLLILRVSAK